uniref:Uncharacterized protein n=1 Tax=Timema poppense TaxID=170557 RepID=A0A7R9HEK9_TIMPO|nr:unnamed protein product [Timema poppensis]
MHGVLLNIVFIIVAVLNTGLPLATLENNALKRVQCSLGLSSDSDCPVDGGWGSWSMWGPCEGECGQVGLRSRTRHCGNPAPDHGGAPCLGLDTDTQPCQTKVLEQLLKGVTANSNACLTASTYLLPYTFKDSHHFTNTCSSDGNS